jgi:hypothetical protein
MPKTHRILMTAMATAMLGGCFSSDCVDMGFTEGTPEHARCEYRLRANMAQLIMQGSQNINQSLPQYHNYTVTCFGCLRSIDRPTCTRNSAGTAVRWPGC